MSFTIAIPAEVPPLTVLAILNSNPIFFVGSIVISADVSAKLSARPPKLLFSIAPIILVLKIE